MARWLPHSDQFAETTDVEPYPRTARQEEQHA
jgi:hypothetical protein